MKAVTFTCVHLLTLTMLSTTQIARKHAATFERLLRRQWFRGLWYTIPAEDVHGQRVNSDTSHNGDKSERRQQKRRHAKTATTKTATTVVKTATVHKSKRRQLLVKTATVIGQNGDSHWSKRRRSLVKTATTNGRNGDNQWSKRRH